MLIETSCFDNLPAPRGSNVRYPLNEVLFFALCAVISGAEDCSDMALFARSKADFLGRFLSLPHGTPSHDTFSRVFRYLDPRAFHERFLTFMSDFAAKVEGVVAVDGKSLRRAYDHVDGQSPLHLVNVWAAEQRLVLGQLSVDKKSNEIQAVPELLEWLSLSDVTIMADAMHCQRSLSEQIVEANGQYVLAVKGNQKTLFDDIRFMMAHEADTTAVTDSGHGRIETRSATVITDLDWLQEGHQWPGLSAVGRVTRRRDLADEVTEESAYYLLSEAMTPERMIDVTRQHWTIENSLHWVLDVTFKEDENRTRCDYGAENLALLRKLTLNATEKEPSKGSKKGKRKKAGWDDDYLFAIIQQFIQLR